MIGRDEELLSAFHDGELTEDEKSAVERLVVEDGAARDALDEIAEVSAWLRSLPRPAAPADLRQHVMSQLRAHSAAAPRTRPASRSARRYANWAAVSATALLLGTLLYQAWPERLPDRQRVPEGLAHAEPSKAGEVLAFHEAHPPQAWTLAEPKDAPVDPARSALADTERILERFQRQLESGEPPLPGEAVTDLTQLGDSVVVVQYDVVDRQEMFGQVQVLLSSNGIVPVPVDADGNETGFVLSPPGDLQAIFVNASNTSLVKAVDELSNLDFVTSVVTNSVSLPEAAQPPEPPTAASRAVEPPRDAKSLSLAASNESALGVQARPESIESLLEPGEEEQADSANGRQTAASPAPASGTAFEDSPRRASAGAYQVPVAVRPELARQLQREALRDQAGRARSDTPASGGDRQVRQRVWGIKPSRTPSRPDEPVRAVILLVPQTPTP